MPLNASTYLTTQGWKGKGTSLDGPNGNGLKKPLVITQKKNLGGIGKDRDRAVEWWDCLFEASAKSIKISASSTPKPITPSSLPIDSTSISTSTVNPQDCPSSSNPNTLSGRLSLIAQAKRDHAKRVLMSGFVRGEIIGTKQEEEIILEKQKAKRNDVDEDEDEGEKKFGRGENLKEKRLREIEEAIKKKADSVPIGKEEVKDKKRKRIREDEIEGKESMESKESKKLRKLEKKKERESKMIRKEEKASRKLEKERKRSERESKRREKEAKKIKKKEIEGGDSSERKERRKRKRDDQDQVEVQETETKSKSKSKSKPKSKSEKPSFSFSEDTSETNQERDSQFVDPKTLIGQKQESELFTPETTPPITSDVDTERRKKKRKKDKKIK